MFPTSILVQMKLLFLFFPFCYSIDKYSESIHQIPLKDNSTLAQFTFTITSTSSTPLLDIFPQPIASILLQSESTSVQGNLVRGHWKYFNWGQPVVELYPPGSSLATSTNSSWTQSAWLMSSVLGGSFESLAGKQYSWIFPFNINGIRYSSNPNEPCCSENVERFIELLPCRGSKGLSTVLWQHVLDFSKSEYFGLTISATRKDGVMTFTGTVIARLTSAVVPSKVPGCTAVNHHVENPTHMPPPVTTIRSLIGTKSRPERIQGKLLVQFTNTAETAVKVLYHEQLPFFLTPLWHTANRIELMHQVTHSDGHSSPTMFTLSFSIEPEETITFSIDVYKRFIPVDKFSFSFEKGFDIGSAVVELENGTTYLTRGLLVVIPLPDATATFNMIAISCTVISVFFGMAFRNFALKRSLIVSNSAEAEAEREAPVVRLIKWIGGRIYSLIRRT